MPTCDDQHLELVVSAPKGLGFRAQKHVGAQCHNLSATTFTRYTVALRSAPDEGADCYGE